MPKDKLIVDTHKLSFTIELVEEYRRYLQKEYDCERISESNYRTMVIHSRRFIDFVDSYYWGEIT
jgi:hypothetical protein